MSEQSRVEFHDGIWCPPKCLPVQIRGGRGFIYTCISNISYSSQFVPTITQATKYTMLGWFLRLYALISLPKIHYFFGSRVLSSDSFVQLAWKKGTA